MKPLRTAQIVLLGLSLGPAAAAGAAASPTDGWLTQVAAAQAAARAADRYILVELSAEWCGWCRKLDSEVFSHPDFKTFARDLVKLRVDVEDGGEGEELQARYRVSGLPTLLVLTPQMVLAGTVEGYAPRGVYMQRINQVIAAYRRDLETYDRLLAGDDRRMFPQLAEELHERGDGARAARAYRSLLRSPEVEPAERVRYLYLLADSLRLDEDFDGAESALDEGRRRAGRDDGLLEAFDLLRVRIAQDRGACAATVAALERFLADHPRSQHRRAARRTLEQLTHDPAQACT